MAKADVDFVVNLRNSTASSVFRARLRPPGYLAAPAYLTAELRRQAAAFSSRGSLMIADNGKFDDIARLAGQLAAEPDRTSLGRRAGLLAATVDPLKHLDDQLAVRPTGFIGAEDITAALWHRLGLTAKTMPNQRAALRKRNRQTALQATAFAAHVPAGCDHLPVASAQDYDTAFDAGREFAAAGLTGAALGFGAFMSDDSMTVAVKIRGKNRRLPVSMPNRYLGTALVARGFWDGWLSERHDPPERFHFLGLGAPIMIGVVCCAARATPGLTFDATSPIKDAYQGTIYVSKPAHLKIRTWKAAERLASGKNERWRCPCPFCKHFVKAHPFDYEHARRWRKRTGTPVVAAALRAGGALHEAFPLLAQPSATPLGREIDFARVGHNHWALKQVTAALARARRDGQLERHVETVVAAYESATALRSYAASVRLSLEIVLGRWPR